MFRRTRCLTLRFVFHVPIFSFIWINCQMVAEWQLRHKTYSTTLYVWLRPRVAGARENTITIRHIIHWFNELCTSNNEKQMFLVFTMTPCVVCICVWEWDRASECVMSCSVCHADLYRIMHDGIWQLNTLRICIYDANMPAATILSVETMNMPSHISSIGTVHVLDERAIAASRLKFSCCCLRCRCNLSI